MHLEANILNLGHLIDAKISEDILFHHFIINSGWIKYEIKRPRGEVIAQATADLDDFQETDNHIKRLVIKTSTHIFEVLLVESDYNGKYQAFKTRLKL